MMKLRSWQAHIHVFPSRRQSRFGSSAFSHFR